jgi:thiamine-monophosphate kinase
MTGEFAAIASIAGRLPAAPDGELWIGDDAAAVTMPAGTRLLVTVDTVVAGVHADLSLTGVDDLGWKALAAAVSDIAAMGGEVGHALVSVAGPGAGSVDLDALYEGLAASALAHGCPVIGGDLVDAPVLVVTVAVTGSCPGEPVRRDGAHVGDAVFVTRPVGASAAGLRVYRAGAVAPTDAEMALMRAHARPSAQVGAGGAARRAGATAMIDISDGLVADLGHLADASGVGIDLTDVPVATSATLEEALGGGEDYALAFCSAQPAAVAAAFADANEAPPIRIGVCTADAGVVTFEGRQVARSGWEHPW